MKIHVATITHKHGINFYAAKTRKGLEKQLYQFVSEWDPSLRSRQPEEYGDAISEYFDDRQDEESLEEDVTDLED